MAEEFDKAIEIQRMYQKLIDEEDTKLDQKERAANAAAKMDKKYGKQWRKRMNLPGLELNEIVEGGDPKEKPNEFFEKMHKHMVEHGMSADKLFDVADIKDEKKEEQPLHEVIQISLTRRS